MSGKRMVHEALFSNLDLADLPIEARYLYVCMIVHADDSGRLKADPRYLKLKAFPFDSHSVDKVRTWRDQLATNGCLLKIYRVGGQEYAEHPNWGKWQSVRKDRMKPTDCPDPCQPTDNQVATNCQPLVDKCPPNLTEPNLTQPNQTNTPKPPSGGFASVWSRYPSRTGRKAAERHYGSSVLTMKDFLDLQMALDNYLRSDRVKRGYIQNGSTWFNNWRDWVNYREETNGRNGGARADSGLLASIRSGAEGKASEDRRADGDAGGKILNRLGIDADSKRLDR